MVEHLDQPPAGWFVLLVVPTSDDRPGHLRDWSAIMVDIDPYTDDFRMRPTSFHQAKRRLADEYDAAQERGEIKSKPGPITSGPEVIAGVDIGLTHKDIHEARIIRDAEAAQDA
jgi:hypothetical protein